MYIFQKKIEELYNKNVLRSYQPEESYHIALLELELTKNKPVVFYVSIKYHDKYSATLIIKSIRNDNTTLKQINIDFKIKQDGYFINLNHKWTQEHKGLTGRLLKNGLKIKDGNPILLHRLIYALNSNLGFKKDIHHINYIRNDNRLNNLRLINKSDHHQIHIDNPLPHYYNDNTDFEKINTRSFPVLLNSLFKTTTAASLTREIKQYNQNRSTTPQCDNLNIEKETTTTILNVSDELKECDNQISILEAKKKTLRLEEIKNEANKICNNSSNNRNNSNKIIKPDTSQLIDEVKKIHLNLGLLNTQTGKSVSKGEIEKTNLSVKEKAYYCNLIEIFESIITLTNPIHIQTQTKLYLNTAKNLEALKKKCVNE